MRKPNTMRALSDVTLAAFVESLPEGMALLDDAGRILWANRSARHLLALRVTTTSDGLVGTALGVLVGRLVADLSPTRADEYARWSVTEGGAVEVSLRRLWASQIALRITAPLGLARAAAVEDATTTPPTPWQLILAERLLEDAAVGLVVANAGGRIDWMNRQAELFIRGPNERMAKDTRRGVARAARHVASGQLRAPIRMLVDLPTRTVEALFWNMGPGMAGVLFDDDVEPMRAPFWRELIA